MIFIKDILHQATVCFALSQSVEQSPKNLPCIATTQFGATVQPFTSERCFAFCSQSSPPLSMLLKLKVPPHTSLT